MEVLCVVWRGAVKRELGRGLEAGSVVAGERVW
jgi:hypothetical protein